MKEKIVKKWIGGALVQEGNFITLLGILNRQVYDWCIVFEYEGNRILLIMLPVTRLSI